MSCAVLAATIHLGAQQPAPPPAPPPSPPEASAPDPTGSSVTEVGGRLIVSSDTVVVVGGLHHPGRNSSMGTKSDTPVLETPRSISVTERATLDDRLAVNISDAHDYTTGVMPDDERGPAFARGFRVGFYDIRRDGLRTYAWSIREPVAIERVQYLRGPAGVLYGDGSPGGLVNLVLKKPLPSRTTELSVSGGTLGFGRVTADTTGPLGTARRWRYRVIAAGEWLDNGFDNDERRASVLPMVSADLADGVTLHLDGEFYHQKGRAYRHTVPSTPDTQRGDFSRMPWSLNVASPDDRWSGWNVSPGARLDARIGDRTSLHASARYTRIGGDLDLHGLSGLAADGRTLRRFRYGERSTWDEWQSDTFIDSSLTTGRVTHRLVLGFEGGLSQADSVLGSDAGSDVDLYEPRYPSRTPVPTLRPALNEIARLGVYVQDQVRLLPSLVVVPSLRWSRLDVENLVEISPDVRPPAATDTAVSPGFGVVLLPRPWLSLYGTATTGFEPPASGQYLEDGRPLTTAESRLLEGGIKADLAKGRLAWSAATFRITQTNVPEADPMGFYRQIGEGVSRGAETELTGRMVGGLGLSAGYAWTRTEIVRDASGFVGRALPNAPRHKAHVWLRYQFTDGATRGVMLATGIVGVSDRFVARNNAVIAPAYTRWDASGTYDLPSAPLRIGLVVQNLTNVRYVTSGAGAVLYAGAPRRVAVQLTTRF